VPEGVLEQVCRDEQHDDEHQERDEQPRPEQPPAPERDEEDGRDDGGRAREDAQQEPARLQGQEALLRLHVPGVDPHAELLALGAGHQVPDRAEGVLRFGVGARVWLSEIMERDGVDAATALFSESTGRVIVTVPREDDVKFRGLCEGRGYPVLRIGVSDLPNGAPARTADSPAHAGAEPALEVQDLFTVSLSELRGLSTSTLPDAFGATVDISLVNACDEPLFVYSCAAGTGRDRNLWVCRDPESAGVAEALSTGRLEITRAPNGEYWWLACAVDDTACRSDGRQWVRSTDRQSANVDPQDRTRARLARSF